MQQLNLRGTVSALVSTLLVGAALAIPAYTQAAVTPVAASAQLPGLPESGWPSFAFNNIPPTSFGGNVQSWYNNYAVIQNVGGAGGSYNFFAHNEGSFSYLESEGVSFGGSSGIFDLTAAFDSNGNLLAGGTVTITGAIGSLGLNDASTVLMTADLTDFSIKGNMIGFAIDNISCAAEIIGCATSADQTESIYFSIAGNFAGIDNLNGKNYRSTIASVTTVPVPAAAWLMLSGLSCIAAMARRRRQYSGAEARN